MTDGHQVGRVRDYQVMVDGTAGGPVPTRKSD